MQELNAGLLEDLGTRRPAERLGQHAVGPAVPVVVGIADQPAVPVQQAEIHAPGVHADAGQRPLVARERDPLLDFVPQMQDIPMQRHMAGFVRHANRAVGEAVDLVKAQPSFG